MADPLFDKDLRMQRRDRASRLGPANFLHEQAFEDILDRVGLIARRWDRALLLGVPDPSWRTRLLDIADHVETADPGPLFASVAGGRTLDEEQLDLAPGSFDLCIAVGTLDTVGNLPEALLRLRFALKSDSLLIGAISGGDTLPTLRSAMRAADEQAGAASPHVHPRIEPSAFAHLLSSAGFAMPVVDVERIRASYRSLRHLVADLRRMGATNILRSRSRSPLTRSGLAAAEQAFKDMGTEGRTTEKFEILHFAAWTPREAAQG